MSQPNKYLDGFHQWWTAQGHTTRSADIYCSGIKRVNDEIFEPSVHKNMFDVLDPAVAAGSAVDWLTALIGNISARIEQTEDITPKKRLQDNRSHLKRFIEYITDLQEADAASNADEDNSSIEALPEGKQYYDRDTLTRIFSIQDRISDANNVFFPIRIISRLFIAADRKQQTLFSQLGVLKADGKPIEFRRWLKKWIKYIVGKVIFHTSKGNYRLSEIEGLLIDSKRQKAWVRVNGKDIPLLSEGPDGIGEMKVSVLRDILLVYTERMDDLLIRLEPALIIMRQLTDDIKASVKGQKVTVNGTTVELDKYRPDTIKILNNWYCDNVDWNRIAPLLPLIRTELNYMAAAIQLVAMSKDDYLKKHKSTRLVHRKVQ